MICRNCQFVVDDDLIFCTNCGERLFQTPEAEPTVLLKEPVYTQPDAGKRAKKSSNLKWVALIVALIAIPLSIFGILLLRSQNRQVAVNTPAPKSPTPAPTRKANTNQNANANLSNANRANVNSNANAPADPVGEKVEIMNERIEIPPREHYAVPFEVEAKTARINGIVTVLEGEKIDGFVYLKKNYDEKFPDDKFKMFSFGTSKTTDVRQTLVEERYVLVFVNNSDKPVVIEGDFSLE